MKLRMFARIRIWIRLQNSIVVENLFWATIRRERVAYRKVFSEQTLENCCCSFHWSLKIEKMLFNDQNILLTSFERIWCRRCHSISNQFRCFSPNEKKQLSRSILLLLIFIALEMSFFLVFCPSKWFSSKRGNGFFDTEKSFILRRPTETWSLSVQLLWKQRIELLGGQLPQELLISENFWIRPLFWSMTKFIVLG